MANNNNNKSSKRSSKSGEMSMSNICCMILVIIVIVLIVKSVRKKKKETFKDGESMDIRTDNQKEETYNLMTTLGKVYKNNTTNKLTNKMYRKLNQISGPR